MKIPYRKNSKLKQISEKVNSDTRLKQLWECANVMAVKRLGYSDHGPTHVAIVANIALKLLRNLESAKIVPNIIKDYEMEQEDAEVVVFLASCLHDIGNSVHRYEHENSSIVLSLPILETLLDGVYEGKDKQIMICEVLHSIICHDASVEVLTLEAGIVKLADALDMKEGRARIPFEQGKQDIYSVSALAIEDVKIGYSDKKPIKVEIIMNNSAGIFQIDNLLKNKLIGSPVAEFVSVEAKVKEGSEKKILEKYRINPQ